MLGNWVASFSRKVAVEGDSPHFKATYADEELVERILVGFSCCGGIELVYADKKEGTVA